jgi:hypothetical protein
MQVAGAEREARRSDMRTINQESTREGLSRSELKSGQRHGWASWARLALVNRPEWKLEMMYKGSKMMDRRCVVVLDNQ